MKFLAIMGCLILASPFVHANVTGPVTSFSYNIRSSGFATDFFISGYMMPEYGFTDSGLKLRDYLIFDIELRGERLSDFQVYLNCGKPGSPSYFQVKLFSAAVFAGATELPEMWVGSTNPSEVLFFMGSRRRDGVTTHLFQCSVPLAVILNRLPISTAKP